MALRRRLTLVALAALAVTLVGWELPAQAKKKVAVLGFSGPGASSVRAAFVRGIKRSVKLVGACAGGSCDATVKGTVSKRGRKYSVVVTVSSGADDDVIGRRSAGARSRRHLARAGASLARSAMKLIAQARGGGGGAAVAARTPAARTPTPQPPQEQQPEEPTESPVEQPTPAEPPPQQQAAQAEDELFTTKQRRAEAEKDAGRDRDDDDEDGGRVRKRRKGKYSGLFDIAVAIGLATRSYELAGANAADNSTYEGGMYPEFQVRLELYPMVLATRGFMRNLGLDVSYSRAISISTKLPSANTEVDTGSQELMFDLRLRWPFFDRPTSPVLSLYGGFGIRDFDLGQNDVLTSFNYKFLRFGLEGIVPLGTPLVSLFAGFDARPLLGIGQEAVEAYGVRSGGFGWAVRGGAYGKAPFGVFYFLAFEYLAFSAAFDGRSDAQPNTIERSEPTTGSDRFIRLWAGAGYAL